MEDWRERYEREEAEHEAREVRRRPLRRAGRAALITLLALGTAPAVKNVYDVLRGKPIATIPNEPKGARDGEKYLVLEAPTDSGELIHYDGAAPVQDRIKAVRDISEMPDTRHLVGHKDTIGYNYWIEQFNKISDPKFGDESPVIRTRAEEIADNLEFHAGFQFMNYHIEKQDEARRVEKIGEHTFEITRDFYDTDGKLVESGVKSTVKYDPRQQEAQLRIAAIGNIYDQQKKSPEGFIYTGRARPESITPELRSFLANAAGYENDLCAGLMAAQLLSSLERKNNFQDADANVCSSIRNN